jgi:murein DD-endopeptidase MepM/ murein hydrolase activator NlpD
MATTVKVKPGDNMSALAAKAGVSLAAMKAANPQIANPSLIRPGQVLNIPVKAATPAAEIAKIKAVAAANPVTPTNTYNQRVVEAIKSGTQATTDVNANPVKVDPAAVLIPGFTPYITPDPKAKKPGDPGFIGPVVPKKEEEKPTWVKAGTVQTEDGAVDVDANGIAKDGSKPTPKQERTLAIDTFRKTLGTFFDSKEIALPWVDALYKVTSGYYKTGSTIDESLNLALKDARNNPELEPFTKRFKGLFALQDKALAGEAIEVPTIAEFYKSQFALGEVMTRAGFPDLATNEFLGEVLGTGKSVAETTALINETFAAIDNAPEALKADLQKVAPGASRTAIAKALLLGAKGAAALNKEIAAATVVSAAKSQGLTLDTKTGADYAARGFGYGETLTTAGNVMRGAAPLEKLTEISTGAAVTPEQARATMQQSLFENNVAAQEKIRLEAEKEEARFGSRPGTMGSRSLASRNRANNVI